MCLGKRPLTIDGVVIRMVIHVGIAGIVIGLELHLGLAKAAMLGVNSRYEIDDEGEDVEGEDESDGPFEHCGCVVGTFEVGYSEADGEGDFDQDEGELDPEGEAQDAVLAEVWRC